MKIAILTLSLIYFTNQLCSNGCLDCNYANECLVCDTTSNYFLNGTTCSVSAITNCKVRTQAGTCVVCNSGYYLGSGTQNCVAVPTANVVTNCAVYSGSITCSACAPSYFINGTLCSLANITVANCATYSANGVCSSCASGYIFSYNNSLCVSIPAGSNCLGYTYASCASCNAGYTLNPNLYLIGYTSAAPAANWLTLSSSFVNPAMLSVCQAIVVTNCVTISSFNTCSLCAAGYFLSAGLCVLNPVPIIPNCSTYSSLTTCLSCNNNYYLSASTSGNSCLTIIPIPYCQAYSTSLTVSTCIQCNTTSYVSGNACFNRTASVNVPNCASYNLLADQCLTCSNGYSLANNNLLCLVSIPNCASMSWSSGQTAFTCTTCSNTFVLTTTNGVTTCVAGSISNCQTYSSPTTCTVCMNKYYLANSICNPHVNINNCATYDPATFNTCAVCANGYFAFGFYQTCVASTVAISNCNVYSTDGSYCVTCASGYYPPSGGASCTQIPTTANCLIYSFATGCTTCANNYIINPTTMSTCVMPADYVTKNCDTTIAISGTTVWAVSNNICVACKNNFIPYAPSNVEAICVLSTDLTVYSAYTIAQAANCIRFGLNQSASPTTTIVVCQQCASGYFLSGYDSLKEKSTATTCVATCPTSAGANLILMDDLIGSVNICIPSTANLFIANCQRIARITYQANTLADYQCTQPASNYLLSSSYPPNVNGNNFFPLEILSFNPNTPVTTSFDYYHGYGPLDTTVFVPSILGWKGILPFIPYNTATTGQATIASANCDIVFTINPNASMYTSGGAFSGYYSAAIAGTMACLRCNPGYQPNFTTVTVGALTNNNPVPVCTAMTNCGSNTLFYGGLPTYLNSALSCHSCTVTAGQATLYPTLFMEADNSSATMTGTFTQYLLVNPIAATTTGFGCFAAPATVTIAAAAPTANNQVANCAVFGTFVFLTTVKTVNTMTPASYCLACATGYVPTYFSAPSATTTQTVMGNAVVIVSANNYALPYMVTVCTAAANCNATPSSKPFNTCGQCSTASQTATPPVYYAYTDFRMANCYPAATPNCFILGGTAALNIASGNACSVCMTGYFLNQDGYCDKYTPPNSAPTASFVRSYYASLFYTTVSKPTGWDFVNVRTHYLLSFAGLQYGTSSCNTNYVLAPAALLSPVLCVASSYLTNNVAKLAGTKFIPNCIKYRTTIPTGGAALSCYACAAGFIPLQNNSACVTTISNCQFALVATQTKCSTCSVGYLNVNGVCSNQVIANCLTYSNTPTSVTSTTLSCSICSNNYSLQTIGTCILGNVANCNVYNSPSTISCNTCAPGFSLMTISGPVSYCYPVPSAINCNVEASSASAPLGFAQGIINCKSCSYGPSSPLKLSVWNSQATATLPQNTCLPFNAITNCQSYAQQSTTLLSNSFLCTNCTSGYYLSADSMTCIARTSQPSGCLWYQVSQDQCAGCSNGLFLNTTGTGCIAYPIGIPNCQLYTNVSTCSMCASGYFLSANGCVLSAVVNNCITYSANNTCTACNTNFYLSNATLCAQAIAVNCLTYTSASVCGSCPFGYAIATSNGITSCNQIVISNCAALSASNQANCGYCNTSYYLNAAGVCTSVTSQIPNCNYYATATTCMNCTAGYTLSADALSCSNTYTNATDPNCKSSAMLATPACSTCSLGYSFVNGVCTPCSLYSSGCWVCDSSNATNCLICQIGYYQVASSLCVPMATIPTTTNTTPLQKSVSVLVMKLLTIIVSIFIGLGRVSD